MLDEGAGGETAEFRTSGLAPCGMKPGRGWSELAFLAMPRPREGFHPFRGAGWGKEVPTSQLY